MSANADVLRSSEALGSSMRETRLPQVVAAGLPHRWNPEVFAREQIRGLVRRVFLGNVGGPVRQVVFSSAEPHLDIASICDRVAMALAQETRAHVALVDTGQEIAEDVSTRLASRGTALIKYASAQIAVNLWRVPKSALEGCSEEAGTGLPWPPCLEELRKEFEYVVIQGPAAGMSGEAALLGQLTDGIILVLGAGGTRRATARKIKETLAAAQCRILGTVLTERTFPMPERIYRRL
jgi:hypothetical protein